IGILQGGGGVALGATAALALTLAGLALSGRLAPRDPEPETASSSAPAAGDLSGNLSGGEAPQPAPAAVPVTDPPSAAVDAVGPQPVDPDAGDVVLPSFDIVRVQPDGETLVAGIAAPNGPVEVLIDGLLVATTQTDATGKFVSFISLAQADLARVISLRVPSPTGALDSADQVILAPSSQAAIDASDMAQDTGAGDAAQTPSASGLSTTAAGTDAIAPAQDDPLSAADVAPPQSGPAAPVAALAGDSGAEPAQTAALQAEDVAEAVAGAAITVTAEEAATEAVAALSAPDAGAATPTVLDVTPDKPGTAGAADTDPAPPATTTAPASGQAPTVILSNSTGVQVLQAPSGPTARPVVQSEVALDAITYEDDGAVVLTGRGRGADSVRIYLDNRPVSASQIGPDGRWQVLLRDIASGTYTLRVDQLGPRGSVTSRVESPFLRETSDALAAASARAGDAAVQAVTVQPGNTLWAIARDRYGEGIAYVRVFEANKEAIRDPDLIYPGQVFTIPE
ncbi:LysM peptidoglycan-binding domain-containing protein, partial [Puniceibacterium confluentis]|uniref:LysM peptidoglycan-binding domain-containing protein n=1 Tax=Puniceibacterium confluentis TaxID=1958944 RepID=UPI003563ABB5